VTSTTTDRKMSCKDVSMSMKQDSKVRVNAKIDTFELIPAGEAGSLDIKGTVRADAGNVLHELSEYAVNGDIQWRDNEDNFKINPVLLDVTKVAKVAGRSRRAGSTPTVFGLASQMTVPHGTDGPMDFMNKMKMSLSIEMETLDDMDLKMSFGDLKAISFFDSGPWFNQAPTPVVQKALTSNKAGATTVQVLAHLVANINVGDTMTIGTGDTRETVIVVAVSADGTVTLAAALKNSHASGTVLKFNKPPAAETSGAATQVGSIIAVCIAVGAATILN